MVHEQWMAAIMGINEFTINGGNGMGYRVLERHCMKAGGSSSVYGNVLTLGGMGRNQRLLDS